MKPTYLSAALTAAFEQEADCCDESDVKQSDLKEA